MQRIKTVLRWYLLLNKRFLKKYIFTFLLLLTPVLVLGMRLAAQGDSGMLHVLVCCEGTGSGETVAQELLDKDGVVVYQRADSPSQGAEQVRRGEADCLWILPGDLEGALSEYLSGDREGVVTVCLREDTVFTRLAREQLYGILYPTLSYEIALTYAAGELDGAAEDGALASQLSRLFADNRVEESILEFAYLNGESADLAQGDSYLTAPLRGMLSLLVLLCGLAAAMFYQRDEDEGIFRWMPVRRRGLFPLAYIFTATADGGIMAYLALYLSGTFTHWGREVGLMVLYVLAVTVFSNLLRVVIPGIRGFGACIPIVLLICVVLCPIFISLRVSPLIQYLLPPYYYLQALHSPGMAGALVLFILSAGAVGLALPKLVPPLRREG